MDESISSVDELFPLLPNTAVTNTGVPEPNERQLELATARAKAAIGGLLKEFSKADVVRALSVALKECGLDFGMDGEDVDASGPPLPELTEQQVAAVIARGKEKPWEDRPEYRMSPFEWVRETYAEWIPGLLQSHLKAADAKLYVAFAQRVKRSGRPRWLDVPSSKEARVRSIANLQERSEFQAGRAYRARLRREARRGAKLAPS